MGLVGPRRCCERFRQRESQHIPRYADDRFDKASNRRTDVHRVDYRVWLRPLRAVRTPLVYGGHPPRLYITELECPATTHRFRHNMKNPTMLVALRLSCVTVLLAAVPALADDAASPQKSLDPAMAAFLVQRGGGRLALPELIALSPEIADILCEFPGDLLLNGVTEIDKAVAASLARHTCESWHSSVNWIRGNVQYPILTLNGVKELSDDAAVALAEHPGRIELQGLCKLTSLPLATKLASHAPATDATRPPVPEDWNPAKNPEVMDALSHHAEQVRLDRLFYRPGNPLHLDHLESLTGPLAAELSRHRGLLSLNGLNVLPEDVAVALGRHNGGLSLNGLTALSEAAAEELSAADGGLSLSGVTSFSDRHLELLSEHEGDLTLDRIRSLSDHQAALLARHTGSISLGGLTEASAGALAAILNKPKAADSWIHLDGLRGLPDGLASVLGACECGVSLCGLRSISPAVVASLAASPGAVRLNGITTMPPEIAQCFAGKDKALDLDGLRELPVELADALADHRGPLSLDGVQSLSRDAAMALSNHEGPLSLRGLSTIEDDVAIALFRSETPIALAGLTGIKEAGARALASHLDTVARGANRNFRRMGLERDADINDLVEVEDEENPYNSVREMNEAEKPDGPKALTPEAARLLAACDGPLILDHVKSLSADTARQLAKHRGLLSLNGLRTIDDGTAYALGDHRGRLVLAGVYTLSEKAALALCRHKDLGGKSRQHEKQFGIDFMERNDEDCDLQVPGLVYVITEKAANVLENKTGLGFLKDSFEPLPTGEEPPHLRGLPGFGF